MKVDFEALERLPDIEQKLELVIKLLESKQQKRWLSSKEAAHYLGYSAETIQKLIRRGDLQIDVHFYQRNRKLIFDAVALDQWIMGIDSAESPQNIDGIISEIVDGVKNETQ